MSGTALLASRLGARVDVAGLAAARIEHVDVRVGLRRQTSVARELISSRANVVLRRDREVRAQPNRIVLPPLIKKSQPHLR